MTLLPEVQASLFDAIRRQQAPRHDVRPWRRLRPVLVTGPIGIAAATALVLVLGSSAAAPAFAITDNPGGTVTVTLRQVAGISALNAELAKRGISARAVPVVQGCGTTPQIAPGEDYLFANSRSLADSSETFYPDRIPHGETLVLAVKKLSADRVETVDGLVSGTAPTCASDLLVTSLSKGSAPANTTAASTR